MTSYGLVMMMMTKSCAGATVLDHTQSKSLATGIFFGRKKVSRELFGEIGVPGKDQDLMKIPSESELCILWDKNNLGSYQLQRLSRAASSFTERDFKSLDLEIKQRG